MLLIPDSCGVFFSQQLAFMIIFAGVKNADENELRSIASEPDATHVYNVADFNIMSSIVEGLTKVVCEQVEQQEKDIKLSKETKEMKQETSNTSEWNFCVLS